MTTHGRDQDKLDHCDDCGQAYIPWFTSHAIWNGVMNGDLADDYEAGGLLCLNCFALRIDMLHRREHGKSLSAVQVKWEQIDP